LKNKRFILLL